MKRLYAKLNTHKEIEAVFELQYFENFDNKGKPDVAGQLHYISSGEFLYMKRDESLYIQNKEYVFFIDFKKKRMVIKKVMKKNPLDKVGKEMLKNLNMDTLMNQSVSNYNISKENDSVTLHHIQYNNYTIPESKIWLNENQSFFQKIEYKVFDNSLDNPEHYSKILMITKSFTPTPVLKQETFKTSTYITKDSQGEFIPAKKYIGYKIIKQ